VVSWRAQALAALGVTYSEALRASKVITAALPGGTHIEALRASGYSAGEFGIYFRS
jgi:hypothetical protein